jgi:alpha-L-fucosidase 2
MVARLPSAVILLAVVASVAAAPPLPQVPQANDNLVIAAPITRWDDAIPLGNGLMGGLLWGEERTLRLSLDRGDLWDERPSGAQLWWKKYTYAKGVARVRANKADTVNQWWDSPYNGVTPTKLPAGRLEIELAPGQRVAAFELNLATAEGFVRLRGKPRVRAFFSAIEPVALMWIPGTSPASYDLVPSGSRPGRDGGPSSGGAVARLGYPAAQHGKNESAKWYVQDAADGFQYCVYLESARVDNGTLLAIAVTSTTDGPDPRELAQQRCERALAKGYAAMLQLHASWWRTFWNQSAVRLPAQDAHILRQYHTVQYLFGAASRRGAPPIPLQGVWTADNGGLPPWKGDYHNDLNTQMTYIAYQSAGHFDQGLSYLDFLWDRREVFRRFARDFYGTSGLACPGVMSLAGQPLGGWGQYSMSPTMSAWSAHLFYLHWRYTMDDTFLRKRAYPWASAVGHCMLELLKPDENGVLKLPLSSSPEIFNNSPRAWLEPNTNYDLMCLKMLFLALEEMADACDRTDAAAVWAQAAAALGDFHCDTAGRLLVDSTTPLPGSHRHLSNIIGLHPFNLITIESGPESRRHITASIRQWDQLGTHAWTGYTFSWMSCLRARVGDAEAALRNLDIYARAFVTRNGFHVNGDQTRSGFSGFTYRPFTLEGNFLAAQAVQEMLLQSWSPTPGKRNTEIIRIFPAMPWRWHSASFRDLRSEGGHRVSAVRENNATTWLQIVAGRDGVVRIRDNFEGRQPVWNLGKVKKTGSNYLATLNQGQTLTATLAKPAAIPAAPANLAQPVIIATPAK